MRSLTTTRPKTSSALLISRELALAADRSLWVDDQNGCITIIARIYDLFDALEQGLGPDVRGRVAADTAAWVGDRRRCAEFLSEADA